MLYTATLLNQLWGRGCGFTHMRTRCGWGGVVLLTWEPVVGEGVWFYSHENQLWVRGCGFTHMRTSCGWGGVVLLTWEPVVGEGVWFYSHENQLWVRVCGFTHMRTSCGWGDVVLLTWEPVVGEGVWFYSHENQLWVRGGVVLLTWGQHLHDIIIALIAVVWAQTNSLTAPFSIEVPVPS